MQFVGTHFRDEGTHEADSIATSYSTAARMMSIGKDRHLNLYHSEFMSLKENFIPRGS
jgi:hypothetical protein